MNDIAILKLDKELNFNENVEAACLPLGGSESDENEVLDVIASGWGSTENGRTRCYLCEHKVILA